MAREYIPPSTRFAVLKRDGFRCQYCGKTADDSKLEIDHIIPVSRGGTNDVGNLITSCFECNRGKSAQEVIPDSEPANKYPKINTLKRERRNRHVQALLTESTYRRFKAIADSVGVSVNEALNQVITMYIEEAEDNGRTQDVCENSN